MDVNKKRNRGDQNITEISDLPNELIDNILNRLPLADAVRTSILSGKWCHHWKRLGNLVFDTAFVEDEIIKVFQEENEEDVEMWGSTFINAVDTVLLLHHGPINKFVLKVPDFFEDPTIKSEVNKWIHYVSRNGVKDITVAFPTLENPIPSIIFHCQELRRLTLHSCIVDLPSYFTGFINLISLQLRLFSADGDGINVLISSCPLLENLSLKLYYKGQLSFSAMRLKTFEAKYCRFKELTMPNVPNLVTASFSDTSIYSVQPHTIKTFFDLMPNIESFTLCEKFFIVPDLHYIPKTLPTPLNCLKHLTLGSFGAVDRVTVLFSLCILRSSPYLQTLNVGFHVITYMLTSAHDEDLAATVAFCEVQFSEPFYLRNIITVKMKRLVGTCAQMAFIKFILASCPALEELYVNGDPILSQATELKIMTELNECSRASSKAKIIYSKPVGTNTNIAVSYSKGQMLFAYRLCSTKLKVVYLNLYSLRDIRKVLCRIGYAPYLQTLDVSMSLPDTDRDSRRPNHTRDYLRLEIKKQKNQWSLRTVTIAGLMGDETELVLVEAILSFCPMLEKIHLHSSHSITSDAEHQMMTDIMRFDRASSQAEIIFSKPKSKLLFD